MSALCWSSSAVSNAASTQQSAHGLCSILQLHRLRSAGEGTWPYDCNCTLLEDEMARLNCSNRRTQTVHGGRGHCPKICPGRTACGASFHGMRNPPSQCTGGAVPPPHYEARFVVNWFHGLTCGKRPTRSVCFGLCMCLSAPGPACACLWAILLVDAFDFPSCRRFGVIDWSSYSLHNTVN